MEKHSPVELDCPSLGAHMSLDTFDDMFEEAREKHEQLHAIFDTLPTITLYGVVGANGPGGVRTPPETRWSLGLTLIAWRIPGAPVNPTPLWVTKLVEDEELRALQDEIGSESLIAFRGKLCEFSPFGDARALLMGLLDQPIDEELELILSKFREPVEIVDPVVGKLSLDKAVDWFEGQITWQGKQIGITISRDESGDVSGSLATAKALLADMDRWANAVNDFAMAELLELKNDNWLDEEENPVSREEFIGRMQLSSITTYPDGTFEFWHDDGGLFWGHSIQVSGSLSEGLTSADIEG